jgi:hypothetical protein
MIAATTLVHGFEVPPRAEKDFKHLGINVIHPFKLG